jgi:hypothetical protein
MAQISVTKSKAKPRKLPVIELLHRWMQTEADYDARVWPRAKQAIEQNRLSARKRFHD